MSLRIALSSLMLAIAGPPETDARWPAFLEEIRLSRRDGQAVLFVEVGAGVPLGQLVKLELFGDFRPGLSHREAVRLYGEPLYRRSGRGDLDRYLGYDTPFGTVEVADQDWNSPPVFWHRRRSLYLYPRASAGPAGRSWFIRPRLLEYLPPLEGRHEVIIAEPSQRVWCRFRGSRLVSVNWMEF